MLDRADKVWPKQSGRFESGKLGSEAGGFGPNVTAITRRFALGPAALDRQIWTIVRRQGTSMLSRLSSARAPPGRPRRTALRSEEHTSELQSLMRISYAVFCLKKKTNQYT